MQSRQKLPTIIITWTELKPMKGQVPTAAGISQQFKI